MSHLQSKLGNMKFFEKTRCGTLIFFKLCVLTSLLHLISTPPKREGDRTKKFIAMVSNMTDAGFHQLATFVQGETAPRKRKDGLMQIMDETPPKAQFLGRLNMNRGRSGTIKGWRGYGGH